MHLTWMAVKERQLKRVPKPSESIINTKPWLKYGISRSSWYRHRDILTNDIVQSYNEIVKFRAIKKIIKNEKK